MKFTLFSRLTLNYLFVFLLVLGGGVYMVYQLDRMDEVTHSILNVDRRLVEMEKGLTDSLLSQVRFEKKFMFLRDENLFSQFLLAGQEFEGLMKEALDLAPTKYTRDLLELAKGNYQKYRALVEEEAALVRKQRPYPSSEYKQEKERLVDESLGQLKALSDQGQKATLEKIRNLEEAGVRARQVILAMGGLALMGILVISFFLTRGITRPISLLIAKTRDVSRGAFEGDLHLSSPPEMKELAEAFNSMCDRLQAVDKMKSDFYSVMSHELRTPLTSIKEGTSLLMEKAGGELTEKQRKLLTIISGESRRLIDLVNSLLDLSRLEEGKMPFHFRPTDILPLIRRVAGEIEPLALAKKIQLQVVSTHSMPPVNMDPERILQVLRNFIGNALKFTPEGGRVKVTAQRQEGGLCVLVEDTGPGISRENLKTVFEKFRQGSVKEWEAMKGSGLGLAIAKQIITEHGGKVWAESQPGQGSSFIFVLPS
jgi:two-component system, NtrC family, sensor histidine kinase GlrK